VSIAAEGLLIASKDAALLLQEFAFAELSEQSFQQYLENQMRTGDILRLFPESHSLSVGESSSAFIVAFKEIVVIIC